MEGLTKKEFSILAQDAMLGSIAVGGTCPNACVFCCLIGQKAIGRQNWTNFISEEDLDNVMPFVNTLSPNKDHVFFGEGPTFLSCEPFNHPNYIGLVKKFHDKNPNVRMAASTVGKFVDEKDFELLKTLNIGFIVSINSFDPEMRSIMMKSEDRIDNVVNFLEKCADEIIKVSLIYGGDLEVLKNDLEFLHSINPLFKNINVKLSLPEYSKYHSKSAKDLFDKAYLTWFEAVKLIHEIHGEENTGLFVRDMLYFPESESLNQHKKDIAGALSGVLDTIANKRLNLKDVGFILSEGAYAYACNEIPELQENFILAKNITFGGSYVVSGLLSKDDIMAAISGLDFKTYVLPENMFDAFGRDIAGNYLKDYGLKSVIISKIRD